MAHKSKTQRAKAAVAKANKKDRLLREEAAGVSSSPTEEGEGAKTVRAEKKETKAQAKQQPAAATKKDSKPKKKSRFQFFNDVRAEMKRVTWPSRTDVIRWSGVVVGALVFFGVYVAILDSAISNGLVLLAGLRG